MKNLFKLSTLLFAFALLSTSVFALEFGSISFSSTSLVTTKTECASTSVTVYEFSSAWCSGNPLTFKWQFKATGSSTWSYISGTSGSSVTFTPSTSGQIRREVYCAAQGMGGWSAPITINVINRPNLSLSTYKYMTGPTNTWYNNMELSLHLSSTKILQMTAIDANTGTKTYEWTRAWTPGVLGTSNIYNIDHAGIYTVKVYYTGHASCYTTRTINLPLIPIKDIEKSGEFNPQSVSFIDEEKINELIVYPNPTSDNAQIYFNVETDGLVTLDIINASGKKVKEIISNKEFVSGIYSEIVSLQDLEKGIYFVRINTSENSSSIKMIVE